MPIRTHILVIIGGLCIAVKLLFNIPLSWAAVIGIALAPAAIALAYSVIFCIVRDLKFGVTFILPTVLRIILIKDLIIHN